MKYFVTGATGFIGSRVAKRLKDQGHEVVALARRPEAAADLTAQGITVVGGDITDKDSMREPMTGCDGVFHIAAWFQVGVRDNSMAERINVGGTANVLELMDDLKIAKGVYTSTLAVFSDTGGQLVDESYYFDGKHISEYDRTKWKAHYDVALPFINQGLPLVIVQPGVVYGPGDQSSLGDALRQYLQGKLPGVPRQTAFCWAHVDDVVAGHLLALEKGNPGESYIIAGPPHTFVEALQTAETITGIPVPRQMNPGMFRTLAGVMELVENFVRVPPTYSPERLRVLGGVTYLGDNSKAKRELGYDPRPLADGLRETLEYELAQGKRAEV